MKKIHQIWKTNPRPKTLMDVTAGPRFGRGFEKIQHSFSSLRLGVSVFALIFRGQPRNV
jgi:hypothetical protein